MKLHLQAEETPSPKDTVKTAPREYSNSIPLFVLIGAVTESHQPQ